MSDSQLTSWFNREMKRGFNSVKDKKPQGTFKMRKENTDLTKEINRLSRQYWEGSKKR